MKWAVVASLIGTLGYAAIVVGYGLVMRRIRTQELPDLGGVYWGKLLLQSVVLLGVLLIVLFVLRLAQLSRTFADYAFTVTGFVATFFGLAMLVVFFASLTYSTIQWFRIMPTLVKEANEDYRTKLKNLNPEKEIAKATAYYRDKKAKLMGVAKTEEEKVKIKAKYDELIEYKTAQERKTVEEKKHSWKTSIREDTSATGLAAHFITSGPATQENPQDTGIYPALLGSLWLALITMLFAVPVGVGAALYLEEYHTKSWIGRVIQVNINNLAGVPSVVYGILGGFVFVGIFRQLEQLDPVIAARNTLGGGLTLGLLTLPIVIVAAQEAIRAVPKSIRDGAYALGATQWQTIWRNVLPMSSPGILTGTILAISRAIGEAAPLIMFGALLFVDQEPTLFSRFTAMPMQIFAWAERPSVKGHEAWQYNAAFASLILLLMLLVLNAVAIYFRNRAQKRMRY